MLTVRDKAKLIDSVSSGGSTALAVLERLSNTSSGVRSAFEVCRTCGEGGERIAQHYLNVYTAGLIAGIEASLKEGV